MFHSIHNQLWTHIQCIKQQSNRTKYPSNRLIFTLSATHNHTNSTSSPLLSNTNSLALIFYLSQQPIMLSRFSKLSSSVLSTVLKQHHNYDQETIDAAVAEIKSLGRHSTNNDDTIQGITKILSIMKKYSESLHVQRVSCHALSNLAMQVVVARWIVQKGGFNLIKKCLMRFDDDHKLCWLGSSAIWNLARPPANRSIIGVDGVKLMLNMLEKHRDKEKVTNTSIGALSNLSLCDSLKSVISQAPNIEIVLSVLSEYVQKRSLSVMTSGAGLVANLAVSDDYANTLVSKGAIKILLHLLSWKGSTVDDTLYRNTCAALNNMVTATMFLDSFLESSGVETIFEFLKLNQNDLYTNLLENCLVNIEVDVNEQTTSFHLCALHGRLEILQNLIKQRPLTDLDAMDSKNMTCLDYGICGKHVDILYFLSKCGASRYQQNLLSDNDEDTKERERMQLAMDDGWHVLREVREVYENAVSKSLLTFPTAICKLLVTYGSNVEMLQGTNQYN